MTRRARDVLIDILRDEGITHVFGNPGSTEMPLMDARDAGYHNDPAANSRRSLLRKRYRIGYRRYDANQDEALSHTG
jgi:hypothetical protein